MGDHILPSITATWLDGEAEQIAENVFYEIVQEFRSFQLDSDIKIGDSRLRRLYRQRDHADAPRPHRPIRYGPSFRRGGRKNAQRMMRRYLDEDGWHKACQAMKWKKTVDERWMPTLGATIHRPTFLVLHLFSGRRRNADFHDAISELSQDLRCDVRIISLDTAVDGRLGELSSDCTTWTIVAKLAREGRIAAAVISEARFHVPDELTVEERENFQNHYAVSPNLGA